MNKDSIRNLVFDGKLPGGKFDPKNEKIIEAMEMAMVREAISRKLDIIIDNTHLSDRHERRYRPIFEKAGYTFEIVTFFNVSLEECIARNAKRDASEQVPEHVIRSMHAQFIAQKEPSTPEPVAPPAPKHSRDIPPLEQDPSLPHAIIVDLDGTIAKFGKRGPYEEDKCYEDAVNVAVKTVIDSMRGTCRIQNIIFCSGRTDKVYDLTAKWLCDKAGYFVNNKCVSLFMRKAGDVRKDAVIKQEIWDEHIKGKFYIEFTIDDRTQVVQFWRSLGLTCFQCADGDF